MNTAKILTAACASCIASILSAATATFNFASDAENVNLWDAIAQDSTYGSFNGNNPYTVYCDSLTLRNVDSHNVSLVLSTSLADDYPLYTAGNLNIALIGLTLTLDGPEAAIVPMGSFTTSNKATFAIQNGASVSVNGNWETSKTGGNSSEGSTVIVRGGSSLIQAQFSTIMGNAEYTSAFTFRVEGENNVRLRNWSFIGAAGTSVENPMGAKLELVADESGLTTIQHESTVLDFSGVVLVDLTNLIWNESWGSEHQFTLVSATNNSATAFGYFCDNQETLAEVDGVSDWLFSYDNNNLYLTVSQVPEPATFAAIFGALALAIAAYRRRG